MKNPNRETVSQLEDLPNIGKAIGKDLRLIGIYHPQSLIGKDSFDLYERLCAKTGIRHDPCVIDVFMSAIDFMEGGEPSPWWSFTGKRKSILLRIEGRRRRQNSNKKLDPVYSKTRGLTR